MKQIWFTADTHFFHDRIIELAHRPFKDINEMHEVLIENWNHCVKQNDDIYILGDLCLGRKQEQVDLVKKLNGNKYLILGNHDDINKEYTTNFVWVKDYKYAKINGYKIVLFHYPIISWRSKERGSWHLHGHVHENSHDDVFVKPPYFKINVGVDLWNFYPVSFDVLEEKYKKIKND